MNTLLKWEIPKHIKYKSWIEINFIQFFLIATKYLNL